MKPRSFVVYACLLIVVRAPYPSSGWAEDLSALTLLRDASNNASHIADDTVKRSALLDILRVQQKIGDEAGAMKTAELEPLPGNKDNAWVTVVEIQASKGNITGAEQTLARISEQIARANALSHIAIAYAAGGDIQRALQLSAEIPENYAARGAALYRIAEIQAKNGDVPAALRTVQDVWRANPYSLIPLMQLHLATGSPDEAVQLTELTEDHGFKSYLLWAVTMAEKNRMRQLNVAATIPVRGVKALTYKDIAHRQLAEGDVQGCLDSLSIATQEAPAVYNIYARADLQWRIATLYARAHDITQSRKVALTIELEGHRNFALREIVGVQAQAQDYEGALQTALLGKGDDSLMDYALSRIAERQVAVETLDRAMETIAKIKSDEARTTAYASVAASAAEAGKITHALTLIQVHQQAIAEARVFVETAEALDSLRTGDARAMKLFSQLHSFSHATAHTLSRIALSRADHGALQEALGYALLIPEHDTESGETFKWLAFNQTKHGDVDGVVRWITAAEFPSHKAFALVGVASALITKDTR